MATRPPPLITHLPRTLTLLIIGDLILDEYLHGTITRTAADFPVPVLLAGSTHQTPGGAANLAQNCRGLGSSIAVHLLGVIGADEAGSSLLHLLRGKGVGVDDVQIVHGRPTTHKMRVVAQMDHRLLRIDRESKAAISAATEAAILGAVRKKIGEVQGIIFSDYNNGVLTPSLLEGVVREATARGLPMVLDPKGKDWNRYEGITVIKPNLNELHTLTNLPVDSEDAVHAAAIMLFRQVQCESLIVTRAEDGVNLYTREGFQTNIPALPVDGSIDVNGAGDTFTAAFALSYFNGASLEDAAKIANAAAGVVVCKTGTATASREEVAEKLSRAGRSFKESAHKSDG
jgi:D-beta-D-heptose 7-phosphate kinase/D-beta-D-heptose 1-phosphate adenosyltransferase